MKKSYQSPSVDILLIDIEDVILSYSPAGTLEDFEQGDVLIGDF